MFVCDECGTATDDSLGFCRKCGSVKGHHVDDSVGDDKLRMETPGGTVFVDPKVANKVPLAMFLAFVPALFDIFGLGQLYLKKYSHAAIFLGLTALVAGVRYFGLLPSMLSVLPLITFVVFVIQLFDLYHTVAKMLR